MMKGGMKRISTGVRDLDEILGGGFLRNSVNVIMGHPGTGKTVLAQQLAFANATPGSRVLYITTMSEPLSKLVAYLQQFAFYDEGRLLESVTYDDIGPDLSAQGPQVLVERIREAIRRSGPAVIIIDSFKVIHDLTDDVAEKRRLVSDLAGVVAAFDTTTFLVGEYDAKDIPRLPEFAVADGIVEFARRSTAKRDERFVRVLKLRGSDYAQGFHAFAISEEGLQVFPRLVSPPAAPEYRATRERVTSGMTELDALLDGGLWRGSTTLVKGKAGTGKTTIALQFATRAATPEEPALYVNFQENPVQLARTIDSLGRDVNELRENGFIPLYMSPVELAIDRIVVDVFETIQRLSVRRVVFDALGDISAAAEDTHRFHDYMYALTQHLIERDITTMMTLETSAAAGERANYDDSRFSSLADCLVEIALDVRGTPRRTLRVAKARGIAHDLRAHEMHISASGIALGEPVELR